MSESYNRGSGSRALVLKLVCLAAIVASAVKLILVLRGALREGTPMDDAFMFFRYATHIRSGLGISWNLDRVHTFGETSLLWGFVVLLLSFLPVSGASALILGSWTCAVAAILATTWAVSSNAKSRYLSGFWQVLPWVALPLVFRQPFWGNPQTGMETMLGAALSALYAGSVLAWARGAGSTFPLAAVAFSLYLTRPDELLILVLFPLLLVGLERRSRDFLVILFTLIAIETLACKLYFGTALPLGFLMKSRHAYRGYVGVWSPANNALQMLSVCAVYLACLVLLTHRAEARLVFAFLLPVALSFAYLLTVTQIMGSNSRYYLPYFPFLVVPALLVLDEKLQTSAWPSVLSVRGALIAGFLLLTLAATLLHAHPISALDQRLERRGKAYGPVHFERAAAGDLPSVDRDQSIYAVTDDLARRLPQGSTMAATEVGYLGASVPEVNVIDLAGLNDRQIALNGFDPAALLARKPDVIWLPHPGYTYMRGVLLTAPGLLRDYDVYGGVAGYGVALRKDSPAREAIDRGMQSLWQRLYPGYRMEDYRTRAITWQP